jgi:CheY-like chemotaxis protein
MKYALIIERDRESVNLLKAVLEPWGIAATSASSAAEAEAMIRAVRPDVILCDLTTKDPDPFAFIQWLRASDDAKLNTIPAIATTAAYEDIQPLAAREAGFNVFLRKPLDPDQLPHIVTLLMAGPR